MATAIRFASVGECMIELSERQDGSFSRAFGGDTANTAVYAARLASERNIEIDYISALGDDPYSQAMLEWWKREGVGTTRIPRLIGQLPGLYTIRTDSRGERSFHYWRSSSAARQMMAGLNGAAVVAALPRYHVIYLSGITLSILEPADRHRLIAGIDAARAVGARVAFDSNYRPRGWPDGKTARANINEMLRRTDIYLPSADDERALRRSRNPERLAEMLEATGVAEICMTDGASNARVYSRGQWTSVPCPEPAEVLDTTAAGDSFNAAYLVARMSGLAPALAAAAGHRLAHEVVRHPGAIIPLDAMPKGIFEAVAQSPGSVA